MSDRLSASAGTGLSAEQTRDVAAALAAGPSEPGLSEWNSELDWLSKKAMAAPQGFRETAKPFWQAQAPDLPVPAILSSSVSRAEADSPAPALSAPPSQPSAARADRQAAPERRVPREARAESVHVATSKPQAAKPPHRIAVRPSYTEKVVEQGDAGEVTYHYRRQVCAPPHMVDVCYMPAENRRNIVVERW